MKVETTRFGSVDVDEKDIYTFRNGILGFEWVKTFCLIEHPGGGPLKWLQADGVPELAFVVCDPVVFKRDYRVAITKDELAAIDLEDVDEAFVRVIMHIPERAEDMTANLLGPLVFNTAARLGRQVVLNDSEYTTKYRVLAEQGTGDAD